MDKIKKMLEDLEKDKQTNVCLKIQKVLIKHDIEPLGDLANEIFDIILNKEE